MPQTREEKFNAIRTAVESGQQLSLEDQAVLLEEFFDLATGCSAVMSHIGAILRGKVKVNVCAYCEAVGEDMPAHMATCTKHPMAALVKEVEGLRRFRDEAIKECEAYGKDNGTPSDENEAAYFNGMEAAGTSLADTLKDMAKLT